MPIKSRALAFAVALPLLLSGCDAGKVLLDPKEMTRRIEGFGQPPQLLFADFAGDDVDFHQ